jgi:glutathione reductase (NADPH)
MEVTVVEKSDGKLLVHASTGAARCTFEADLVVHGAGRVPELDDLNLTAAGIQAEEHGLKVNEYPQSISNPGRLRSW